MFTVLAGIASIYSAWFQGKPVPIVSTPHGVADSKSATVSLPTDSSLQSLQKEKNSGKATVKLIFKASPLLTEVRHENITRIVDEYCRYLKRIGFDPPTEFPPLGVAQIGGWGATSVEGQLPSIYDEELRIGAKHLDSPKYVRAMYSRYIFAKLLRTDRTGSRRDAFEMISGQIVSNYFLADFSNTPPPERKSSPADNWISALWDIRRTHGKVFTNSSLFYAFKRWNYPVDNPDKEEFDRFFRLRFSAGEHIEDNNLENAESISSILNAHGLPAD